MRQLQITKRRIPLDRADEYGDLWRMLREAAERAGARAWLFHSTRGADHIIEFVEWQSELAESVFDRADVSSAFTALNAAFSFEESNTWLEARI